MKLVGLKYSDLTRRLLDKDKWSLTKGGCKGRFDCIVVN